MTTSQELQSSAHDLTERQHAQARLAHGAHTAARAIRSQIHAHPDMPPAAPKPWPAQVHSAPRRWAPARAARHAASAAPPGQKPSDGLGFGVAGADMGCFGLQFGQFPPTSSTWTNTPCQVALALKLLQTTVGLATMDGREWKASDDAMLFHALQIKSAPPPPPPTSSAEPSVW